MTKEEAIQYLQQLYPNGGHCWLDEQRIEAINMAIDALKEDPVTQNVITKPIGVPTGAVELANIPDKRSPTNEEIGDYDYMAVMESLYPQLKEEPTIPDIVDEHFDEMLGEEPKECMYSKDHYTDEDRKVLCDGCEEECKYAQKEEPVSEFMNIESMIESYKQRLISQANGVKNSPLIDMCLASYKHGINETLDTLNLSNVQRIGKNWKKSVSEPSEELAETYLAVFNRKFPILPSLKGKQLADYKNFLNKCQQIFGLKEWGIRPIQSKLFEKLTLLWAAWGAEHLQGIGRQDEKEQDIPVSEELPHIHHRDILDEFAYQCAYDLSNDWAKETPKWEDVETACKLGAQWQKTKDEKILRDFFNARNQGDASFKDLLAFKEGVKIGRSEMKKQMMAKAIDAHCFGFQGAALFSFRLPADNYLVGSEVKVIVINED